MIKERRQQSMKIHVYEMRLKLYVLKDITYQDMLSSEAAFIDSALAKDEKWGRFHECNCFKLYVYNGMHPLEKKVCIKRIIYIQLLSEQLILNLHHIFQKY